MEDLSVKQQEILKSFRYAVEDVLEPEHDSHFLLQFLKARNFNEDKAEAMLRKSMNWRKQMRVRNFLDHYKMPEVFEKYHPGGFLGHDKSGCPVWMLNSGCLDVKGFVESSSKTDFMKYQIHRFETLCKDMREQSKKLNRRIHKMIYIMDEENLAVSQILNKPVLETLLSSFSVFEANYPETLKRCYVINVPKPFFILYSFIKPLLSEETANKVKIFGKDGWKEALLEDIDASVLPVHWGGTRVDSITGDPKCTSLVNFGGPVPESYHLRNRKRLRDEPDVESVIVPKRDYIDVPLQVNVIGSIIEWEVETEENDLAIGLYYKKTDASEVLEELVPSTRTETYRAAEQGSYECENVGKYYVRLDNTFSWISAKKVTYRIRIDPPLKSAD